MNRCSKTRQQLLLDIEELRTKLDVAQQRLQEANEGSRCAEQISSVTSLAKGTIKCSPDVWSFSWLSSPSSPSGSWDGS
jgi:hypothetical protein